MVMNTFNTTVMDQLDGSVADNFIQQFQQHLNIGYSISDMMIIVLTVIFAILTYWLFYTPCTWTKKIEDVSYDLFAETRTNTAQRKEVINRIRRLRKVGLRELPPPFPNGWYSIMEASDIKAGEAKSIACLGEQFLVFRTLENKVFVLDAYCPHMGTNLGVGGRVIGNNIECPFHLWAFRGEDGLCTNVPYSTCVPHGTKLKKWISREINDFIFIWFHSDPHEIPWELPVVEEIEKGYFVYHGRNEFFVNCHIQEIPENGADLAHFKGIHNASMFAMGSNPKKSIFSNAGNHQWEAVSWEPSKPPSKHMATITLKHSIEICKKLNIFQMNVKGDQIGPSYVQLHMRSPTFGRIEVLQTVTPIEPLVQKVVHRFYAPRLLGPIMKFVVFGESIMFERDMAMWNHKIFKSRPQLVKEDASIKGFRNWFSQFYSENSKTFAESRENFDW